MSTTILFNQNYTVCHKTQTYPLKRFMCFVTMIIKPLNKETLIMQYVLMNKEGLFGIGKTLPTLVGEVTRIHELTDELQEATVFENEEFLEFAKTKGFLPIEVRQVTVTEIATQEAA